MAGEMKPEVVILDIAMPQLNGLDAGDQIKHLLPRTKLVYLTVNMSPEVGGGSVSARRIGIRCEDSAAAELLTAIRRALKSESYLSPLHYQRNGGLPLEKPS